MAMSASDAALCTCVCVVTSEGLSLSNFDLAHYVFHPALECSPTSSGLLVQSFCVFQLLSCPPAAEPVPGCVSGFLPQEAQWAQVDVAAQPWSLPAEGGVPPGEWCASGQCALEVNR